MVFALGLSLFGVYSLPVIDLKGGPDTSHNPKASAFFTGVLATLLATPCSGPFLGGVLAWALLQPPQVVAAVFSCIGLGMALPYLLMALRPSLVRFFPRPGAWTLYLEKLVAFFLLGTCIYLLQILPPSYMFQALILLWVTALGLWVWGKLTNLSQTAIKRWSIRSAAMALILACAAWAVQPPQPEPHWQEFSAVEFQQMLGRERMLVDFTADWCVSCKYLEKTTLVAANLDDWRDDYGLIFVRVDLTGDNPDGMALLSALGSKSIPLVAVFPAGEGANAPLVLRDLFRTATMDAALENLFND